MLLSMASAESEPSHWQFNRRWRCFRHSPRLINFYFIRASHLYDIGFHLAVTAMSLPTRKNVLGITSTQHHLIPNTWSSYLWRVRLSLSGWQDVGKGEEQQAPCGCTDTPTDGRHGRNCAGT